MYQEALWPLALVYSHEIPGNRWYRQPRIRELVLAGLRFTAASSHTDGSCDDYFPFERAYGAAAFATNAAAQAYLLLSLNEPDLRAWFARRADWLAHYNESGRLANHQALAALALYRISLITGQSAHREAASHRLGLALAWQSSEGWFEEYGGADPGYQTITLDCLAAYRNLADARWLNPAIQRGLQFARVFLHPDGSYAGEYGSRGTHHFYPHGMELLAGQFAAAADLADGYLNCLAHERHAHFSDDRMFAHYAGNLLEAWLDWSPTRPPAETIAVAHSHNFPQAGLVVRATDTTRTIISTARGGIFKHFDAEKCRTTDAGLVVEFADRRIAVSQLHDPKRAARHTEDSPPTVEVTSTLHWAYDELLTPWKNALFRMGMLLIGRWCGNLVRKLLQRRIITGRRTAPVSFSRRFEFHGGGAAKPLLRVIDTIKLTDPRIRVTRMSFGTDHQSSYVAACGIYHDSVLEPWTDLTAYVAELNESRGVTIVREF
jgi:hypothetical protein